MKTTDAHLGTLGSEYQKEAQTETGAETGTEIRKPEVRVGWVGEKS